MSASEAEINRAQEELEQDLEIPEGASMPPVSDLKATIENAKMYAHTGRPGLHTSETSNSDKPLFPASRSKTPMNEEQDQEEQSESDESSEEEQDDDDYQSAHHDDDEQIHSASQLDENPSSTVRLDSPQAALQASNAQKAMMSGGLADDPDDDALSIQADLNSHERTLRQLTTAVEELRSLPKQIAEMQAEITRLNARCKELSAVNSSLSTQLNSMQVSNARYQQKHQSELAQVERKLNDNKTPPISTHTRAEVPPPTMEVTRETPHVPDQSGVEAGPSNPPRKRVANLSALGLF